MKQFIYNRKWEKIAIKAQLTNNQKSLAIVMHGLWGFKEQEHIQSFIQAFLDNHISVISFDTTNSFWESDGNYEDATITNYYEDLEDVINWVKNQDFYEEPFFLAWHSAWWLCIWLYAQKFSDEVKAIAPISSLISGTLSIECKPQKEIQNWEKQWYQISQSKSKPWIIKKLKWSHMQDRLKYNLLTHSEAFDNIPVLLIVWENDITTPLTHQEILLNSISWDKQLHIIKWAWHTFRKQNELKQIYEIMKTWISEKCL